MRLGFHLRLSGVISRFSGKAGIAALVVLGLVRGSTTGWAADVTHFTVEKGLLHSQTSTNPPTPKPAVGYFFRSTAATTNNGIISATVRIAGQSPIFFTLLQNPSGTNLLYQTWLSYATLGQLDALAQSGTYTQFFTTVHDGMRTQLLTLSGNSYPPAPRVANFIEAQSIVATNAFVLNWDAFPGGTTNDLIQVTIANISSNLFSTGPQPRAADALNGTNTSVLIPAGTLQPGRAYYARLAFSKVVTLDTMSYPGAVGFSAYVMETDFYVTTVGAGDVTPPTLVGSTPPDLATNVGLDQGIQFHFSEPMRGGFLAYSISGTSTGLLAAWSTDLRTFTLVPTNLWPASTLLRFTLNPSSLPVRFGDSNFIPLAADTVITVTTGATNAPLLPPRFDQPLLSANRQVTLRLVGQARKTYGIDAATDLNLLDWTALTNSYTTGGVFLITLPADPAVTNRYFRGRLIGN